MLPIFDGLRDVTLASVTTRMLLAVLCGGLIGIERAYKRRPAGFRTHILICLGAAITTLTSQFLYLNLHYYTDMAPLGGTDGIKRKRGKKATGNGRKEQNGTGRGQKGLLAAVSGAV